MPKKYSQREAPEYLLEYGKPIISERKIRRMTQEEEKAVPDFSPLHGAKSERIYYIVEFPQNESIKRFEEGFVAQVYVWADNSHPFTLVLGNGLIQRLK